MFLSSRSWWNFLLCRGSLDFKTFRFDLCFNALIVRKLQKKLFFWFCWIFEIVFILKMELQRFNQVLIKILVSSFWQPSNWRVQSVASFFCIRKLILRKKSFCLGFVLIVRISFSCNYWVDFYFQGLTLMFPTCTSSFEGNVSFFLSMRILIILKLDQLQLKLVHLVFRVSTSSFILVWLLSTGFHAFTPSL